MLKITSETTIAEIWADFDEKVVPKDASDGQREDMKNCFYAGARVMYAHMVELTQVDEDTALVLLQRIHDELEGYFTDLVRPNA